MKNTLPQVITEPESNKLITQRVVEQFSRKYEAWCRRRGLPIDQFNKPTKPKDK